MRKPLRSPISHRPSTPAQPRGGGNHKPVKPCRNRLAAAHDNLLLRGISDTRIRALDDIATLAGERPSGWIKPTYGDFEYWLARNCGWISDKELQDDIAAYDAMRERSRNTSMKYQWEEGHRYAPPKETDEYIPEVNMRLIKDRNLTDSARRIALFVMRHIYQDQRENRSTLMTVSFIMKGLSLSRRTVQRNLTLLQKHGYVQSDVVPSKQTRMSIGLMISLLAPLFPKHHKKQWPKKRRTSGASHMTHNHSHSFTLHKKCSDSLPKIHRREWSMRCANGILRKLCQKSALLDHSVARI